MLIFKLLEKLIDFAFKQHQLTIEFLNVVFLFYSFILISNIVLSKELYKGMPNSDKANYVLYTVGGMQTNPVPPQKLKGKD